MQIPTYIRTTSMVLCITIMLLGVIGNVMVPIVIMKTKDMRNSTNIFLTNLSIADLLVLLVCTPTVLVEVNSRPETWVLGHDMCKAVPFVELTVAHASVLTILAISFERYYAICEPLKAGYVCTKARALMICLAAWVVAAVFTSPMLSISQYGHTEYMDGSQVPVCLTAVDAGWPIAFYMLSTVIFFVAPLLILIVLYTVIAKHLMDNPGITSHGNRSNVQRYRKQVIFMLGTVVVSFFACLLPFRALTVWIIVTPAEQIVGLGIDGYYSLLYFCRIMLYLNSALNPILYNLMSSKFRDGFYRLLCCRSPAGSKKGGTSTLTNRSGGRAGTFHTASTNLSSSQSAEQRQRSARYQSASKALVMASSTGGETSDSDVPAEVEGRRKQAAAAGARRTPAMATAIVRHQQQFADIVESCSLAAAEQGAEQLEAGNNGAARSGRRPSATFILQYAKAMQPSASPRHQQQLVGAESPELPESPATPAHSVGRLFDSPEPQIHFAARNLVAAIARCDAEAEEEADGGDRLAEADDECLRFLRNGHSNVESLV